MLHRSIPLARFLQNYLPELWGFIFGGVFGPKFSVSLAAKNTLDAKMFWRSKNGMDLLYHHAEYGGAWISCTTQRQGKSLMSFFCFLFSLSVTLFNSRVFANDFAIKVFEYGNAFDNVGNGRFVAVHLRSTPSLRH